MYRVMNFFNQKSILVVSFFTLMFLSFPAKAVLTIEISDGFDNATPIAVVPFGSDVKGLVDEDIAQIVAEDLRRSGRFKPLSRNALPSNPTEPKEVVFEEWRPVGVDNLVMGAVTKLANGKYQIDVRFMDVLRKTQVFGRRWTNVAPTHLRKVAHMISDMVYEELTGIRGAFNTRIAYVTVQRTKTGRFYTLEIADSDGMNPQSILKSPQPIMSPSWSPDGEKIAYVSFENGRSEIFVQSLDGKLRQKIAGFKGINSAPAWSPDGSKLAMTLSKDGSADIYVKDMSSGILDQITRNPAIETEAVWSADGNALFFSSDRRGQPQIFKYDLKTGQESRVTFEGRYNSNADISPDGRYMAMVRGGNGFHIALQDNETNLTRVVTDTFLDESPSFSPNGEMILYAMNKGNRGQLAVVSVEGKAAQTLQVKNAEVREPAWGPYLD